MKKLGLALSLLACLTFVGCNGQTTAQTTQAAIAAALSIAKADIAVVPAQDQSSYSNYITLAQTLDGQLSTCIANVSGIMGKNAKFLSCFNTFTQGLVNPSELALLRVLNPSTQQKIQLYVTAVVSAVNIIEAALGGNPQTAPSIGAAPSSQDLGALQQKIQAQLNVQLPAWGY